MSHLIFLTKKVGRNQNQGETSQGEMSQGEMSQGEMSVREKCLLAEIATMYPMLSIMVLHILLKLIPFDHAEFLPEVW